MKKTLDDLLKRFYPDHLIFPLVDYNLFGKLENRLLVSIGPVDLEFLHLGYQKGGTFDENDIENSNLKRIGIGRILDSIASLKERKLITQNKDRKFSMTDLARQILWNNKIPIWVKILRLLEIKSFSQKEISDYLGIEGEKILNEIETLRKNELVLMSPLRRENGLEKMYEILPLRIERLEKINSEGYENVDLGSYKNPSEDIFELLEDIRRITNEELSENEIKGRIFEKLDKIKSKLKN